MKNDVVEAIIEIPYRSRNKYEVDKETGRNMAIWSKRLRPTTTRWTSW